MIDICAYIFMIYITIIFGDFLLSYNFEYAISRIFEFEIHD